MILSDGMNGTFFRDPSTGWLDTDDKWRIVVGNKSNRSGVALLYESVDFFNWVKAEHPLHSSNLTEMWECPDFYPVPISGTKGLNTSTIGPSLKHVLKVSLGDNMIDYYIVGTYFSGQDRYVPDNNNNDYKNGLRYDYGKFYASKSFFDQYKQRRNLWGWVNESDSVSDDITKGWFGLQADVEVSFDLPRLEITEFEEEMGVNLTAQNMCSRIGSAARTVVGPFGLLVLASKDLNERIAVFF